MLVKVGFKIKIAYSLLKLHSIVFGIVNLITFRTFLLIYLNWSLIYRFFIAFFLDSFEYIFPSIFYLSSLLCSFTISNTIYNLYNILSSNIHFYSASFHSTRPPYSIFFFRFMNFSKSEILKQLYIFCSDTLNDFTNIFIYYWNVRYESTLK